jgi:DNA-binding SARP family transcriptional activator
MRGFVCVIWFCLLCPLLARAQSYGLRFSSHETVQEKRTALNLTPTDNICLNAHSAISFDLRFVQGMDIYFGYILRLITTDKQNIDVIFNQRTSTFNIIIGETQAGSFVVDSPRLYQQWSHIELAFDVPAGTIQVQVNHHPSGKVSTHFKGELCGKLVFGASSLEEFQTADIPPMSLKDLRITSDGETQYYWPLSEVSGTECYDSVHHRMAKVLNPTWIRPQYQNWEEAWSFEVKGIPAVAFDPRTDKLYVNGPDSLYVWGVQKGDETAIPLSVHDLTLPPGNQSIIDPRTGSFYNFYIDQKKVRTFNPEGRKWDGSYVPCVLTEFWHANKFLSPSDSALYIVDGYGQLHYKNLIQRYSFGTKQWETVPASGDAFTPRYLSALGINAGGDTAYILGGYGSNTGDQMVNPRYYYDLMSYSVKDHRFKSMYHLPEPAEPFCLANSLIIEGDHYYGLIFSNEKFNSSLQLIKGSLHTPQYQLLGGPVPYSFHDVKSFADLYYAPQSQKLLAVTMYTNKEGLTEVKVYTISFPPNALSAVASATPAPFPWRWVWIGLGVVTLGGLVWFGQKTISPRLTARGVLASGVAPGVSAAASAPVPDAMNAASGANAPGGSAEGAGGEGAKVELVDHRSYVQYFGQFEVYDKEGTELTKLFTPLLKEMFLLIVLYTLRSGKGISSEKLYATLWKDKSSKDAQNNRSVNMVKLKAILDKLGTCSIQKEADKWVFHYASDQIRMDLAEFLALVQIAHPTKEDIHKILSIVQKGSFLSDTAYAWLDDIQSEVSDKALDVLTAAIGHFSSDPEFLLEIAAGIFLFDPVNEEALRVKCKSLGVLGRHSLAKAAFEKFAKEYAQMYGEDFRYTFHDILSN